MPLEDKATLRVAIDARGAVHGATELKGAVNDVSTSTVGMGSSLLAMAGKITAIYASFRALTGSLNFIKREMLESEKANFKLAAAYDNLDKNVVGGIAGLQQMADAMANVSIHSDETIKTIMAMMMSFKNIDMGLMPRFLRAVMDLASMRGIQLEDAGFKLALALDAPAEGLARLAREGIYFSDAEEKIIKKLTEANKLLEAQVMIFEKLEERVKGFSEKELNTLGGQLSLLKNQMGELITPSEGFTGALKDMGVMVNKVVTDLRKLGEKYKATYSNESDKKMWALNFNEIEYSRYLFLLEEGIKKEAAINAIREARKPMPEMDASFFGWTPITDPHKKPEFLPGTRIPDPMRWESGYDITDEDLAKLDKELDAIEARNAELDYFYDNSRRGEKQIDIIQMVDMGEAGIIKMVDTWTDAAIAVGTVQQALHDMGKVASEVFADAIVDCTSFANALGNIVDMIKRMMVQRGLEAIFNYFAPAPMIPIKASASGNIFTSPDLTTIAERGPEVVLPLKRGTDGNLGVGVKSGSLTNASGGVTVQIISPDARGIRDILLRDPRFMMELQYAFQQGYASI